jgi:hypothetical protein
MGVVCVPPECQNTDDESLIMDAFQKANCADFHTDNCLVRLGKCTIPSKYVAMISGGVGLVALGVGLACFFCYKRRNAVPAGGYNAMGP